MPILPPVTSALRRALTRLKAFWPTPVAISTQEKGRATLGAALGLLLVALAAGLLLEGSVASEHGALALMLVAPIGASAVLVFAVPSSPLAQPWAVVAGNTLSTLVGVACVAWVPNATLAGAVAVGAAIAVMLLGRCLHPPGGAAALLTVLAGNSRWQFALNPVLVDSLLLVAAGLIYNNLTGRPWPHLQPAKAQEPARFTTQDLDAALAHYNQVLDVSRDDLQSLLEHAEGFAYQRKLGGLRCADVMSTTPVVARQEMALREAWALLRSHKVKALPVVDRQQHLVGIVTVADFIGSTGLDALADKVVASIMTRTVRVASADRLLIDLVPVFADHGHRHIPIIEADRRVVGMITQSDLIRALYRAVRS
ncbi:HPP family protein [Pseudomonas sp. HR96]|uniref:HPP family protein n=1 Tax=Pseudomonas sp. HR96 TaxID=1027966 RepID=UPI002A756AF8|nr:HPP family protein [Pseudomonas sp. HR96]WPP01649.1 HPP family protein [Pseudomonas sp. HR96]